MGNMQTLHTLTAGGRVLWVCPADGVARIECLSRLTWPAGLILDVQVSLSGTRFTYPSGFATLQFTANGICSAFSVAAGSYISVSVNTASATDALIELTPSFGT